MTWSVTREGGVVHADLGLLETNEWTALVDAVVAEIAGSPTSQVVIHAGERPPDIPREALVESLSQIVEGGGTKVRVVYAAFGLVGRRSTSAGGW
jgi:hypothetical protein